MDVSQYCPGINILQEFTKLRSLYLAPILFIVSELQLKILIPSEEKKLNKKLHRLGTNLSKNYPVACSSNKEEATFLWAQLLYLIFLPKKRKQNH